MKALIITFILFFTNSARLNAQQIIIIAENLFYIEHNSENELEIDLFLKNYKNEKQLTVANIFTIDLENLVVKTEIQNKVKAYPIINTTNFENHLDCVYLDTTSSISYHLEYYYNHPSFNKPFLFVSWKNNHADIDVSESVYIGPEAQLF